MDPGPGDVMHPIEAAAQALEAVPDRGDLHVLGSRLRLGGLTPAMALRFLRQEQEPGREVREAIEAVESAARGRR